MTPNHLNRLLEIYCSTAAVSCPHVMTPTGITKPLDELEEWGLIERIGNVFGTENHGYGVTQKGRVYVEAVLETPMPVWAVDRG